MMKQLRKKEIKRFIKFQRKRRQRITLLLENIQYARNVASIFRTADASGVERLYLTGISRKPPFGKELKKVSRKKEFSVPWAYSDNSIGVIRKLKKDGYKIFAIEMTDKSSSIYDLPILIKSHRKICFVAGSEVYGITKETLKYCDESIFIPMFGKGASLNVAISVGIVLYSF